MGSTTQNQLIAFIALCTLLFCIVIAFDLVPYLRGPAPYPPDWQWDYLFVNTLSRIWMPAFFMGAALFFAFFLEQKSEKYIRGHEKKLLLIMVLLFFFIQLSVIYFSRAGIGVLFARIVNPDMNGYFTAANSIENVSLFLSQFNEQVLSLPMHAQGHPPGAILFFWGIEHMIKPIAPIFSFLDTVTIDHGDVQVLWKSLTLSEKVTALFTAMFIPFLASLSCIFVYYIGKFLYSARTGIRSALLLLAIPSLIFFIPINDVFLPLFPLASFFLFIKAIGKQKYNNSKVYRHPELDSGSTWIPGQARNDMVLSGFLFSVGLFFSLSLLPLLFIFLVHLILASRSPSGSGMTRGFFNGFIFALGIVLLPIFLFLLFRYNTFTVAQTLLSGLPESRTYLTWVFFNLSDFFIFLGIPLFVFSCFVILSVAKDLIKLKIDPLIIGFIGMLLILDISGTVRGEVARIWIPFYPFLAIILSMFVTKQLKIKRNIFLVILFLQFVQILFMQEFWVMLW